jgi:hypothetical protein
MAFCPVIVVVMLESRVARCVRCEEDVAVSNILFTAIGREMQSDLLMMG